MPILTAAERLGTKLAGRYSLHAVIGGGGMGVLFQAVDDTTEKQVAIKMLRPEYSVNPERVARFLRETRIAATLQHPNIATVKDWGKDETGAAYLVMELLAGRSLEQELAERRVLPFEEALGFILPIARALVAAHALRVIHRDVKPSNIFLCRNPDGSVVPKLLDFGIAKSGTDEFETQTGMLVGSPGYMAPEQVHDGTSGPYTDVWGIAAVLYRCTVGNSPHAADSLQAMLAKRVREPVVPFAVAGVRKSTCVIIDRALEREPERRYATMRSFINALEGSSDSRRNASPDETQDLSAGALELQRPDFEQCPVVRRISDPRRRPSLFRPVPGIVLSLASAALFTAALLAAAMGVARRPAMIAMEHQAAGRRDATTGPARLNPPRVAPVSSVSAVAGATNGPSAQRPPTTFEQQSPGHRGATAIRRSTPHARKHASTQLPVHPTPEYERRTGLPLATEW